MQKKYSFSLDKELVEALREQALKDFRSLSSELQVAIKEFLEKHLD